MYDHSYSYGRRQGEIKKGRKSLWIFLALTLIVVGMFLFQASQRLVPTQAQWQNYETALNENRLPFPTETGLSEADLKKDGQHGDQ